MCQSILSDSPSPSQAPTFEQLRQSMQVAGVAVARLTGERTAKIPSATSVGAEYTVWIQDGGAWAVCECPDGGDRCWHAQRALELYAAAQAPTPAPVLYCPNQDAYLFPDDEVEVDDAEVARLARIARGRAAVADLCGVA